jgi:hypothetical protein
MLYVPSTLIVPGDAAATAQQIMASEGLFRMGIASDSIVFLSEIILVAILYILLERVNRTLSLAAAFSRLAMAVIQGVNLFASFTVLLLLSGAAYLSVFETDQLHALVMLVLNAHDYGVYLWQVFFGLHLIVLGYLVFKSGYFPKILGILLVLASPGYLLDSFGNFLVPGSITVTTIASILLVLSAFGELAFAAWLLIKGARNPNPAANPAHQNSEVVFTAR